MLRKDALTTKSTGLGLPEDPEELERQLAVPGMTKPGLPEDPYDADVAMGLKMPRPDDMSVFQHVQQLSRRALAHPIQGISNAVLTLADVAYEGTQALVTPGKTAFRMKEGKKASTIPRWDLIDKLEQRQWLYEPNWTERTLGYGLELAGELAPITALTGGLGLTGLPAITANGLAFGGFSMAQGHREEKLAGKKLFTPREHLEHGLHGFAAIPIGGLVGAGAVMAVERLAGKALAPALKGIINTAAVSTAFETYGLQQEGIDIWSPEGASRLIGGFAGFGFAHLHGTLYSGAHKPRTPEAVKRSVEITENIAKLIDLGLPKQRTTVGLTEAAQKQANFDFARNWYANVMSPVLDNIKFEMSPETLAKVRGITVQEAKRIQLMPIPTKAIRTSKFFEAQEKMAAERGDEALTEYQYRTENLDPIRRKEWERIREKEYTPEELDKLIPTPEEVRKRVMEDDDFRMDLDGFGSDPSRVLEKMQAESEVQTMMREFAPEGPKFPQQKVETPRMDMVLYSENIVAKYKDSRDPFPLDIFQSLVKPREWAGTGVRTRTMFEDPRRPTYKGKGREGRIDPSQIKPTVDPRSGLPPEQLPPAALIGETQQPQSKRRGLPAPTGATGVRTVPIDTGLKALPEPRAKGLIEYKEPIITPAPEAKGAKKPPVSEKPTVKMAKEPDGTMAGWDVTVAGETARVYRDPENGYWYHDSAKGLGKGHFSEPGNFAGFNKKEAVASVTKRLLEKVAKEQQPAPTPPRRFERLQRSDTGPGKLATRTLDDATKVEPKRGPVSFSGKRKGKPSPLRRAGRGEAGLPKGKLPVANTPRTPLPPKVELTDRAGTLSGAAVVTDGLGVGTQARLKLMGGAEGSVALRPVYANPKSYETLIGARVALTDISKKNPGRDYVVVETEGKFRVAQLKSFEVAPASSGKEAAGQLAKTQKPAPLKEPKLAADLREELDSGGLYHAAHALKVIEAYRKVNPGKELYLSESPETGRFSITQNRSFRADEAKVRAQVEAERAYAEAKKKAAAEEAKKRGPDEAKTSRWTEEQKAKAREEAVKWHRKQSEEAAAKRLAEQKKAKAEAKAKAKGEEKPQKMSPLERFNRELYDIIEKNPGKSRQEIREIMGDVTSREAKHWAGVSKAFLAERETLQQMYREYRQLRSTKKEAPARGLGAGSSPQQERFVQYLETQVPDDFFGGPQSKRAFVQEEIDGGWSSKRGSFEEPKKAGEAWDARPEPPREEALQTGTGEWAKNLPKNEKEFYAAVEQMAAERRKEKAKRKPKLTDAEKKLSMALLTVAGGGLISLAEKDEETKQALADAGLWVLLAAVGSKGKTVFRRNFPKNDKSGQRETPVEKWFKEDSGLYKEDPKYEAKMKDAAEEFERALLDPTSQLSKKPSQKVKDDVLRKQMTEAEKDAADFFRMIGTPTERTQRDVIEPPPRSQSGLERWVRSGKLLNEMMLPSMEALKHNYGTWGRGMWHYFEEMHKRLLMDVSEAYEFTRSAFEGMNMQEELRSSRSPKQIKEGIKNSDRNNFYEIHDALEYKLQRPVELDLLIQTTRDRMFMAEKGSEAPYLEKIKQFEAERKRALQTLPKEEPNSWQVEAQVLGALAYTLETTPAAIAKAWGRSPSGRVLGAAKARKNWESKMQERLLALAQQHLDTAEYKHGPYSPANPREEFYFPQGVDSTIRPKHFDRQTERAMRIQERAVDNYVYKQLLKDRPISREDALANMREMQFEVGIRHRGLTASIKKQGNVDYRRLVDISIGTERDSGRLMRRWVMPAYERINYARQFQSDGFYAKSFIQLAGREGFDVTTMIRLHDDVANATPVLSKGVKSGLVRELAGLFGGIALLGSAGISQLTSAASGKRLTPWKHFARALFYDPQSKTYFPAGRATIASSTVLPEWFKAQHGDVKFRKFATEVGQMAQSESVQAMIQMGGFTPRVSAVLQKTLYMVSPFDRFGRYLNAISGRFAAGEMLADYQKQVRAGKGKQAWERWGPAIREMYADNLERVEFIRKANYTAEERVFLEKIAGQVVATRASGRNQPGDMPLMYHDPMLGPLYKLQVFTWQAQKESYRTFDFNDPTSLVNNPKQFNQWLNGIALMLGTTAMIRWIRSTYNSDPQSLEDTLTWKNFIETTSYMGFYPFFIDTGLAFTGRWGQLSETWSGPVYTGSWKFADAVAKSVTSKDQYYVGRAAIQTLPTGPWSPLVKATTGLPAPKELANKWYPPAQHRRQQRRKKRERQRRN